MSFRSSAPAKAGYSRSTGSHPRTVFRLWTRPPLGNQCVDNVRVAVRASSVRTPRAHKQSWDERYRLTWSEPLPTSIRARGHRAPQRPPIAKCPPARDAVYVRIRRPKAKGSLASVQKARRGLIERPNIARHAGSLWGRDRARASMTRFPASRLAADDPVRVGLPRSGTADMTRTFRPRRGLLVSSKPMTTLARVVERRRAAALARHYRDEQGLSIAEIARRLGRAPATVKAYLYDPSQANKRPRCL